MCRGFHWHNYEIHCTHEYYLWLRRNPRDPDRPYSHLSMNYKNQEKFVLRTCVRL